MLSCSHALRVDSPAPTPARASSTLLPSQGSGLTLPNAVTCEGPGQLSSSHTFAFTIRASSTVLPEGGAGPGLMSATVRAQGQLCSFQALRASFSDYFRFQGGWRDDIIPASTPPHGR